MRQTENLALNLPEGPDHYNEKDYNDNFEIIDQKMKYLSMHISDEVIELNATENKTYIAPDGKSFNPVNVQVAPDLENIYITQNGTYESIQHEGYKTVTVNVSTGTPTTGIKIVKSLPELLTEGALYLIPDGEQIVPEFPVVEGLDNSVVCLNKYNVGDPTQRPDYYDIKNATKFWLYLSSLTPKTRRDQITVITWGNNATTSTPPEKIYEYDTNNPQAGWVDITDDADTEANFQQNTISHDIRDCIFSNNDIYRWTVGNREYNIAENSINDDGKINNIYLINNFNIYLVVNGTAINQGVHDLKWVADNFG